MVVQESNSSLLNGRESEREINLTTRKEFSTATKKSTIEASATGQVLYQLIKEKKWDDIMLKLDEHESEAREWIGENNDDESNRWKSLLIHLVCERKCPVKVIAQLLSIYPESVSIKNSGGDLPIHVACREGASHTVIEELLQGDGYEGAKVVDCEGRLPLHLAASNKETSAQTIQTLITVYDRATRTPDDFSLLPLHWACSKNNSARVVETIIQAYPYAVEAQDAWGRTPLALAKMSKSSGQAQTIELLSRDVSSWTTAMMSTVVTLSNKVLEFEQKEALFKKQSEATKEFNEVVKQKDEAINALNLEFKRLEQTYKDEVEQLKEKHTKELEAQKHESDEAIAKITKEKELTETKLAELKKLVDEVVAQLREHQVLVEEKEASRKKLKLRALDLLKKIEIQKEETRAAYQANSMLKKECIDLQYELDVKDAHLDELQSCFRKPLELLGVARSRPQIESRSEAATVRAEFVGAKRGSGIDETVHEKDVINNDEEEVVLKKSDSNCVKLDDGSVYAE